jgi:hypothetical protein
VSQASIFIIYSHKENKNTMEIRVSKRGGKRRTWLIGCRKVRARIKTVVASSGSAEEVRKKLVIVHNKEKKGRRGILKKGSHY